MSRRTGSSAPSSKLVTRPINQKISKGSEESRDGINPKTPSELFDITLVLGEEKLYTSRLILNFASPVWRKMLTSDFKEKSSSEIPLPEKSYQAVLEMLLCITPGINKHITPDTVFLVLPLADEYQIESLKKECQQVMLQVMGGECSLEKQLQIYRQTEKYPDLDEAARKSVSMLRECSLRDLQRQTGYLNLIDKLAIVEERVLLLETVKKDNETVIRKAEAAASAAEVSARNKEAASRRTTQNKCDILQRIYQCCYHKLCSDCGCKLHLLQNA